jgi:muconolactone delta-isomerase
MLKEDSMKFLSMCSVKESASMVPPATMRQLLEAQMAWTEQQKKAGKLLEVYAVPGGNRYVAICEHPTVEDAFQVMASMPTAGIMTFDVYPLAEVNSSMRALIESLKAAEKMTPGREMAGVH